jgi:hypothetical protein
VFKPRRAFTGAPALTDLDNNGITDIVYGGFDGVINVAAERHEPAGLPRSRCPAIRDHRLVAIGGLDGAAAPQLDRRQL